MSKDYHELPALGNEQPDTTDAVKRSLEADTPIHPNRIGGGVPTREVGTQRKARTSESIAREFHDTYERLAPSFGYTTREETAKPWNEVPAGNRYLMLAVVDDLRSRGIIK